MSTVGKGYVELKAGDVRRKGDQWKFRGGSVWGMANIGAGKITQMDNSICEFRRPVKARGKGRGK